MALSTSDFKVADMSLADFGRKELDLAEHEMPGLMSAREEFSPAQPLGGTRMPARRTRAPRATRGGDLASTMRTQRGCLSSSKAAGGGGARTSLPLASRGTVR